MSRRSYGQKLDQMHKMNAIKQLDQRKLSDEEKKNAIASLIFLTEKRDGTLKTRKCADGRKQWEYMLKDVSTSPTVTMEAIFITSMINSKEKQEIAVVHLPGAFLHADNDEDVIMFMWDRLAELMSLIAP